MLILYWLAGDEVKDVQIRVPQSIKMACISNSIMLFIFVVVLLFFIGPMDDLLDAPLPLIYVLYNATGSKPATNSMVGMLILTTLLSTFNIFASVSRLIWAFARDGGLPFSGWFSYVHPKLKLPSNALFLIGTIVTLLSLIYIGSTTAFNAILSLSTLALYASYVLPILFILLRKLRGPPLPYGPVRMGLWGVPCNIFALCYLIFIIIWIPFPSVVPVDKDTMNYAGPIFGGTVFLAFADWVFGGRRRFRMPVKRYGDASTLPSSHQCHHEPACTWICGGSMR